MFDYAILGLGKTGLAVLEYLSRQEPDKKVLASDAASPPQMPSLMERYPGVEFETGGHSDKVFQARTVVKSPGMASGHPLLGRLRERKVQVVSEIEFAFSRFSAKPRWTIGVSGTNGKTTVTHLIGHLLSAACRPVVVAGNIGSPLIGAAAQISADTFLVLELSSYQLEDSGPLGLDCGILMNITPDHLDHHGSLERYIAAKAKLLDFVKGGAAILNFEDAHCRKMPRGAWKHIFFSSQRALKEGAWVDGGRLHVHVNGRQASWAPAPGLMGVHNLENQMAALLAGSLVGLNAGLMQAGLQSYEPPPHRLQRTAEVRGVLFINDSKATNVESALVALRAVASLANKRAGRIHLLLGGLDKGFSYRPIAEFVDAPMRIYAYGQAGKKIEEEIGSLAPLHCFEDLNQSVRAAFDASREGDLVLLSPACASFDQFKNFEHRGEAFAEIVRSL